MPEVTFHDLSIPFPLFEAPVSDAADYVGIARCSLCHKEGVHCFQLGGRGRTSSTIRRDLRVPLCGVPQVQRALGHVLASAPDNVLYEGRAGLGALSNAQKGALTEHEPV